jgi:hypothetical protein
MRRDKKREREKEKEEEERGFYRDEMKSGNGTRRKTEEKRRDISDRLSEYYDLIPHAYWLSINYVSLAFYFNQAHPPSH